MQGDLDASGQLHVKMVNLRTLPLDPDASPKWYQKQPPTLATFEKAFTRRGLFGRFGLRSRAVQRLYTMTYLEAAAPQMRLSLLQ